jgi:proteasome accessory factor C
MKGAAGYAKRLAVLPGALAVLELHPDGLPLSELASELRVPPAELREVFLAYYLADLVRAGDYSLPVVEFFAPGADDPDGDADDDVLGPVETQWVRVVAPDPERELGVDHLSADQLGALYRAGADLLALEPDNDTLRSALAAFDEALWPAEGPSGQAWLAPVARRLYEAARDRRRVRIGYTRQWRPGGSERVIEPYRVLRTRRGWEVDAGPPDEVAAVRTYLVSGIGSAEELDEHFEPPADVDDLLAAHRTPTPVDVVVPQARRWAVERFAESVTVLDDDEDDVSVRASLLPPVEARLGLLLLSCGPTAFVTAPRELRDAGVAVARELAEHHRAP